MEKTQQLESDPHFSPLRWRSAGAQPHSDLPRQAPDGCGTTDGTVCRRVAVDRESHLPTNVVAQSQRSDDLHHWRPIPHWRRGDATVLKRRCCVPFAIDDVALTRWLIGSVCVCRSWWHQWWRRGQCRGISIYLMEVSSGRIVRMPRCLMEARSYRTTLYPWRMWLFSYGEIESRLPTWSPDPTCCVLIKFLKKRYMCCSQLALFH